jgi:hypothetical protein
MSVRVKHFSSALLHALKEERHFALMDGVAFPTLGSLVIVFQVRNSVRPMHLFGRNRDHDYYFELPRKGERDPQSISRCSTAHHGDFRVVPRVDQGLLPAKFHENNSESKAEWERLRSGEIDFAVEKLRLSACLIRSVRG